MADAPQLRHEDDSRASRLLLSEGPGRSGASRPIEGRSRADKLRSGSSVRMRHRARKMGEEAIDEQTRAAIGKMSRRDRLAVAREIDSLVGENDEQNPGADAVRRSVAAFSAGRRLARGVVTSSDGVNSGRKNGAAKPVPTPAQRTSYGPKPVESSKVADGSATRPSSRLTYTDEADMGRGGAADATERRRKQGAFRKIKAREALKQRRKVKMIAKVQKAEAAATAIRARRTVKAAHAATFAAKGVGAISIAALPVMLACALFLIMVIGLVSIADEATERPAAVNELLPEACEIWRPVVNEACTAILGDTKWADLALAMMAQESGGSLDVVCWPGGVKRQDIMQACEGAYGSWITVGGGPYSLTPCTPEASIYAGVAEMKQNLDLWSEYLGGIEPWEVDKVKLVVQGYNYGAQGYYNWNVRHGYKEWTLERSKTYSQTVMPAGAKGTPEHADYVMRFYVYTSGEGEGVGAAVIAAAKKQLGVPYVWGGTTPFVGLDCSGLTQWCYRQAGIEITRTTYTQVAAALKKVPVFQARPGDVLWNSHHVAIYVGNGEYIHAPHTGDVVRYGSSLSTFTYALQFY